LPAVHEILSERILTLGKSKTVEYRLRRPTARHVGFGPGVQLIPTGRRVTIFGATSDISERKQVEEELRASHSNHRRNYHAIPVRVFWKDRDLVYLGCNAIFARDAGFADSKDIVGKDDYQMRGVTKRNYIAVMTVRSFESGRPKLLIEEPQTTPKGNTIILLTSKIPLRNSEGEIIGVLGTYMDITDRKHAEEAFRESELKAKDYFRYIQRGIIIVDTEGRIAACQPADDRTVCMPTGINDRHSISCLCSS